MKVQTDTIARTIVLFLALLNQVFAVTGIASLNIEENDVYQLASLVALIGSALWSWWKNNSFTQAAIEADKVKDKLKGDDE